MTTPLDQKNIVGLVVFGCVLVSVGAAASFYESIVIGNVDPKWTPWQQFFIQLQIVTALTVEAVVGYGFGRRLLVKRQSHGTIFTPLIAAVFFILAYVVWMDLIMAQWRSLFEHYAPSPVQGFWGHAMTLLALLMYFSYLQLLGYFQHS